MVSKYLCCCVHVAHGHTDMSDVHRRRIDPRYNFRFLIYRLEWSWRPFSFLVYPVLQSTRKVTESEFLTWWRELHRNLKPSRLTPTTVFPCDGRVETFPRDDYSLVILFRRRLPNKITPLVTVNTTMLLNLHVSLMSYSFHTMTLFSRFSCFTNVIQFPLVLQNVQSG